VQQLIMVADKWPGAGEVRTLLWTLPDDPHERDLESLPTPRTDP
jgi:hypothetical protein